MERVRSLVTGCSVEMAQNVCAFAPQDPHAQPALPCPRLTVLKTLFTAQPRLTSHVCRALGSEPDCPPGFTPNMKAAPEHLL